MFSDFQDLITAKTQKMLNSEWVVRVHATYVQIWPPVSFLYCLSLSLSLQLVSKLLGPKETANIERLLWGGKRSNFIEIYAKLLFRSFNLLTSKHF